MVHAGFALGSRKAQNALVAAQVPGTVVSGGEAGDTIQNMLVLIRKRYGLSSDHDIMVTVRSLMSLLPMALLSRLLKAAHKHLPHIGCSDGTYRPTVHGVLRLLVRNSLHVIRRLGVNICSRTAQARNREKPHEITLPFQAAEWTSH